MLILHVIIFPAEFLFSKGECLVSIQNTFFAVSAILMTVAPLFSFDGTAPKTGKLTKGPLNTVTGALPSSEVPHYSNEELHKFWDDHLNRIVMFEVMGGKHPVPAVNALYRERAAMITQRYNNPFWIALSETYSVDSAYILAACDLQNGTPILKIFVPSLMYVYRELLAKDADRDKNFESLVVVTIFHELDHIALGLIGRPGQTKKEFIAREAATWAATCHTIALFIALGLPVETNDLLYYQDWTKCGQQMNACWSSAIGQAYAEVLKHFP